MSETRKVIIIGTGPAGYTAAIYTARANFKPLVFAGPEPGGQLTLTTLVENYPGFADGIMGPELMEQMKRQCEHFGAEIIYDAVTKVNFRTQPFEIFVGDQKYLTETVIISTGASAKWLGLESERQLRGHGVSSCATCDGAFFRNQEVIVVGGGDVAMEDASFLTKFASKVTIVHRRDALRASKIMQERAFKNPKISFIWDSVVEEIHDVGKGTVTGVTLRNVKTNQRTQVRCDGVFVAIGHQPNTEIFKGQIELDEVGYIKLKNRTMTNIEGVFAAGDVVDHYYRQAVTAAGMGCMAAIDVEKYLEARHG
ncbi:MAG: thioredoxin-disulfide reductase [candidate division KSB1 bacterium]|nr:thioredoxin-disulfide reductase [candidate division KSB1 bacterium]MDZ7302039.1 thioredoxin-disulfide reductase [candidate division KSB1 bacterium]MDZ7311081.1 thioredoxin-disulfide reductase [candidate division KSB1 bacterium]